LIKVTYS